MDFKTFQLQNGVRVVTQRVARAQVGHLGIMFNVGSRDETESEQGLAHYLEHILFKGTQKRKAYHILNRLDRVGGELNAYTTKEEICLYGSFQKSHLARAMELIADVAFNSTFPEKEIIKEKEVIFDEIHSYKDSPSERIFDDYDELAYPNHPMGRNILGTLKSVKKLTRQQVVDFHQKYFAPENAVISYVGSASEERIMSLVERYFSDFQRSFSPSPRVAPTMQQGVANERAYKLYQSHVVLGFPAPSLASEQRKAFGLLNNLIGGPGLNSLLNLNIREKHGITYQIESNFTPTTDHGQFQIYFATDPKMRHKCLELVKKEIEGMQNKPLSSLKLSQWKKQLIGHLALSQESNSGVMLGLAKSMLHFNRVETDLEIFQSIEKITSNQIQEAAEQYLNWDKANFLTFL